MDAIVRVTPLVPPNLVAVGNSIENVAGDAAAVQDAETQSD